LIKKGYTDKREKDKDEPNQNRPKKSMTNLHHAQRTRQKREENSFIQQTEYVLKKA
jgi:hypothetical protein